MVAKYHFLTISRSYVFNINFITIATKFPLKQMPTLEVDGKVICQSYAIFRFLANELGLYGSSNMDKAIADQVAETINEMFTDIVQIMFISKEPEEKKVLD